MENYNSPRFTMSWLGQQTVLSLVLAGLFALVAIGIGQISTVRLEHNLIAAAPQMKVAESVTYAFAVQAITLLSLVIVEIAFRREVNFLQMALIGAALCLFYLLLLSMAEQMAFVVAYVIVTLMTVGLIGLFVKGLTKSIKAAVLMTVILLAEYGVMYVLLSIGALAMLVGSFSLFAVIAVAMYFTLKIKLQNNEIVIK